MQKLPSPIPKFLQLSFIIALISGCLTPIDFETDNKGGRLVVSGQASNLPGRTTVLLGETSKDNRIPIPVSGALVKLISSEAEVFYFIEDFQNPGVYAISNWSGNNGDTYQLEITLPSGKVYESVPEKMPETVGSVSTYFEIKNEEFTDAEGATVTQSFVKIYSNSSLPKSLVPTYLRWSVEEVYLLSPTDFPDPFGSIPPPCFVNQNAEPQRIVLYNGFEFPTQSIEGQLVCSRLVDFSFLERHYFTTYQTSLTPEAHEYLRKVNVLANQVGSIFDTPPAEIKGNIENINATSEQTLGYFRVVNETYDRLFMMPGDFPTLLSFEACTFDGSFRSSDYPPRCINCLTVRNSSYRRPDWF